MGVNDGGLKRGDRADTGDNEARPTEGVGRGGSGVHGGGGGATGNPTADASSMGGNRPTNRGAAGNEDDLTIRDADDPTLGLGHGPEG